MELREGWWWWCSWCCCPVFCSGCDVWWLRTSHSEDTQPIHVRWGRLDDREVTELMIGPREFSLGAQHWKLLIIYLDVADGVSRDQRLPRPDHICLNHVVLGQDRRRLPEFGSFFES